jgi:molybdopterin synthase sulfur carrier subunit
MKVLVFGILQDVCKTDCLEIDERSNIAELKYLLEEKFPALKEHSYAVAVNQRWSASDTVLKADDTLALLPPFSGG